MKVYNELSKQYDSLFLSNLQRFIDGIKNTDYFLKDYVTFYPSFGVIKDKPVEFINDVIIAKQFSNKYPDNSNFTPLDWVNVNWSSSEFGYYLKNHIDVAQFFRNENTNNSYKAYRSFFWNTVYKTVSDYYQLQRGSIDWSKKIVWSNLYKIAPDGANPNEFEKEIQLDLGFKLFESELSELQPKYCVLLTNESWWLPFQKKLDTIVHKIPSHLNLITNFETLNNTKIIVTTRPRFGNGEEHTKQILEIIQNDNY
jgi:hypothetical protein